MPISAAARHSGDNAVAGQNVPLSAFLGWPDHVLTVDAANHVTDFTHTFRYTGSPDG